MTRPPLDLEAIRQRVDAVETSPSRTFIAKLADSAKDVPDLLAEVERLRSGIETVLGLASSPGPRAEYILRDLLEATR